MNDRRSRPRRCTHSAVAVQPPARATSGATRNAPYRLRRPPQLLVDDFLELLEGLGARQHATVDEERRRAGDTDGRAVGDVLVDVRLELRLREALIELLLVESHLARHRLQLVGAEIARCPQLLMIGPALALRVRAVRGLRG